LKWIDYHTNDYTPHDLIVDSISGTCPPVCIVNNIAHLTFQSVRYHPNPNGYTEVAKVLLTGDTTWTLNSLPIEAYDAIGQNLTPGGLIAKYNGVVVGKVFGGSGLTRMIKFKGGFIHTAYKTDTLKIFGYKYTIGGGQQVEITMGDLNYFEWVDGVGGLITGDLNAKFYKEQTGAAGLSY
jgi:hypothetical protein